MASIPAPEDVNEAAQMARRLTEWVLANGYDSFAWRMAVADTDVGGFTHMVLEVRPAKFKE